MGVNFPNVLVVPAATGIKTLGEYVAKARREPGKLDFASTGPGSASHLAGELLNDVAKIDTLHVPYKGGAPALQDVLGNRVTSFYAAPPTALPHIESGKLIPLATTGLTRPAYLPNVPTVAESFPGFNATNWYAFVASAKTPKPLLDRWNTELVKVLNTPKCATTCSSTARPPPGHPRGTGPVHWRRARQVGPHHPRAKNHRRLIPSAAVSRSPTIKPGDKP